MNFKSIPPTNPIPPTSHQTATPNESAVSDKVNNFPPKITERRRRHRAQEKHWDRKVLLNQSPQLITLPQVYRALVNMGIPNKVIIELGPLRPFTPIADFCEEIADPYVIQREYRNSMQFGSLGVELLASYYERKCAASIVVPRLESEAQVSIEDLPDVAHNLFEEVRSQPGDIRRAFLLDDDRQCVPVIYIKENIKEKDGSAAIFEAIFVADSRGGYRGDAAQVLGEQQQFNDIHLLRVDAPRRSDISPSDQASSYVDAVKFGATITGRRAGAYILPNLVQELRDRSKESAIPDSGRVKAVTLPFELTKSSQLAEFIAAQRKHDPDPLRENVINRPLTRFAREHQITVDVADGNGGSVPVERIDWVRKESFKDAERMQIEFYNQKLEEICEKQSKKIRISWTPELQNRFAQSLKDVRRGKPTPPPTERVQN